MKNITKTDLIKDANTYYGVRGITNNILQNYISMGLIERLDSDHVKGVWGSVSYWPKSTPGMFYLIDVLKNQGFGLMEIKRYLDLTKLDSRETLNKIRDIMKEDSELIEIKNQVCEEDYKKILKLYNLRKSLKMSECEKFKRVIELRAYAEMDYKEITNILIKSFKDIKNKNDLDKIQDNLDNPGIEINIDDPEKAYISVTYKEPFNKTVLFTKDKIEAV